MSVKNEVFKEVWIGRNDGGNYSIYIRNKDVTIQVYNENYGISIREEYRYISKRIKDGGYWRYSYLNNQIVKKEQNAT